MSKDRQSIPVPPTPRLMAFAACTAGQLYLRDKHFEDSDEQSWMMARVIAKAWKDGDGMSWARDAVVRGPTPHDWEGVTDEEAKSVLFACEVSEELNDVFGINFDGGSVDGTFDAGKVIVKHYLGGGNSVDAACEIAELISAGALH